MIIMRCNDNINLRMNMIGCIYEEYFLVLSGHMYTCVCQEMYIDSCRCLFV